MTSIISPLTINGRQQSSSTPPDSPLRRNPPNFLDAPAIPPLPLRLDGAQRGSRQSSGQTQSTGTYRDINTTLEAPSNRFIPPRSSSKQESQQYVRFDDSSDNRSSRDSLHSSANDSYETSVTTPSSPLTPALAAKHFDKGSKLDVLLEDEYEVSGPMEDPNKFETIEWVSELLYSEAHLQIIFSEPSLLLKFTSFLSQYRPQSIPTLIYYLDATKALMAIRYADTIAQSLEAQPDADLAAMSATTSNPELESRAKQAFALLAERELPAYVAHMYIQAVKSSMMKPVTPSVPHAEVNEGFAEIFCLTDPSRPDNPIVLASEAFHQMTQYSMNYIIGRNCRFLQGPKTNPTSLDRIRKTVAAKQEHCEVFLNYRRDGSPFMNLFMHAPLFDHLGKLRYFMGAQIDVSHVIEDSPELESLQRLVKHVEGPDGKRNSIEDPNGDKDAFQKLVETLDMQELAAVRAWEDRIFQESPEAVKIGTSKSRRPGIPRNHHSAILKNGIPQEALAPLKLGMYNNYMLVRPYPSLRVLFASPSLNIPGMVGTPIMDHLGGSQRVRYELTQALEEGKEVTAKVRWKVHLHEEPEDRWIFFTPLVGKKGEIGVWMAILEDDIPESMERVQITKTQSKPKYPSTSPILEEEEAEDEEAQTIRQISTKRHSRTFSDKDLDVSFGGSTQVTSRAESSISSVLGDYDGELESLETRLRKKRERDLEMMLNGSANARRTYKSLSPEALINIE